MFPNDHNAALSQSEAFALLREWDAAKKAAANAVSTEKELRARVLSHFSAYGSDELTSGVENVDIGGGFDLKMEHKLNYKLDRDHIDDALNAIEKLANGELLAERLVKFTPELAVGEYKKLPAEAKTIIDRVITVSRASSSVSIAERKK